GLAQTVAWFRDHRRGASGFTVTARAGYFRPLRIGRHHNETASALPMPRLHSFGDVIPRYKSRTRLAEFPQVKRPARSRAIEQSRSREISLMYSRSIARARLISSDGSIKRPASPTISGIE